MAPEHQYLRACSQHGLIIDTNLLALFLIGSHRPDLNRIRLCSRISGYDLDDFKKVVAIASKACKIVVTPQILAELADITFDIRHNGGFDLYFKQVVEFVSSAHEKHTDKEILISEPYIKILSNVGFTDTSIVEVAQKNNLLVLTDDGKLTGILATLKVPVLNMNHLRGAEWLSGI